MRNFNQIYFIGYILLGKEYKDNRKFVYICRARTTLERYSIYDFIISRNSGLSQQPMDNSEAGTRTVLRPILKENPCIDHRESWHIGRDRRVPPTCKTSDTLAITEGKTNIIFQQQFTMIQTVYIYQKYTLAY